MNFELKLISVTEEKINLKKKHKWKNCDQSGSFRLPPKFKLITQNFESWWKIISFR